MSTFIAKKIIKDLEEYIRLVKELEDIKISYKKMLSERVLEENSLLHYENIKKVENFIKSKEIDINMLYNMYIMPFDHF